MSTNNNTTTDLIELQSLRQRALEDIQDSAAQLREARHHLMNTDAWHRARVQRFEHLDRKLAELDGRVQHIQPKKARRTRKTTHSTTECMQVAVEKLLVGLTDEQRASVIASFNKQA